MRDAQPTQQCVHTAGVTGSIPVTPTIYHLEIAEFFQDCDRTQTVHPGSFEPVGSEFEGGGRLLEVLGRESRIDPIGDPRVAMT